MRIAVVVASLALAGAVQAQAQTGAWKVGSGTPVTLKGSNPATGEPNSSSLAVGCNLRTGRIYGSVSVIPFSFPNGKAVLTWDEREDVLRTFEGLEGFDYPALGYPFNRTGCRLRRWITLVLARTIRGPWASSRPGSAPMRTVLDYLEWL